VIKPHFVTGARVVLKQNKLIVITMQFQFKFTFYQKKNRITHISCPAYTMQTNDWLPYPDAVVAAAAAVIAAASWVSTVSCPCNACSGTRRGWRADWVRSSRRAVPSSERRVAGWRRSTCAACEAVSRSAPSVSASSFGRNLCESAIRSATSGRRYHQCFFHQLRASLTMQRV